MKKDLPYRQCVGIALFNGAGDVFIGRRKKERGSSALSGHDWQMPQGGIDEGESPLEAAKRELYEETSVKNITVIAEAPDWLTYDFPPEASGRWGGRYRGQKQKWFLFRLDGDDGEVEIHAPGGGRHHAEFRDWRWESWEALPSLVVPFKCQVYQQVIAIFAPIAREIKA